jgi:hypothetical protein
MLQTKRRTKNDQLVSEHSVGQVRFHDSQSDAHSVIEILTLRSAEQVRLAHLRGIESDPDMIIVQELLFVQLQQTTKQKKGQQTSNSLCVFNCALASSTIPRI